MIIKQALQGVKSLLGSSAQETGNPTGSSAQGFDPSDPKYKMGIVGRILGAIANFGSGMQWKGPLVYTGKVALNGQYYQDLQNYRDKQKLQGQQPDRPLTPHTSPLTPNDSVTPPSSFNPQPRLLPVRAHRVGDTVLYGGQPHVIQAVNNDGSIHISPVSSQPNGFFST